MEGIALDPSGHIKLSASNFAKSKVFYSVLFKELGFKRDSYGKTTAGWISKEGFGVWLTVAKRSGPKPKFEAPGLHHLCFKARSPKEVDAVYELVKGKARIFDKPAKYPQYTKRYYAVFFADPDGIKLEVAYY